MQIAPIVVATDAPWHETPAVAAYLATITAADLRLRRPCVVMGTDELEYTGNPVEQLQDMRREIVDERFGCTFREAMAAGRAHQYLDFESDFATADEVLAELFGDPRRFGNMDLADANRLMCGEARRAA